MLYNLLTPLAEDFQLFNLFRYLTFRSGAAALTALALSFLLAPGMIAWLRARQTNGQPIREDGPKSHLETKRGTPTMGGALILTALVASTLLWADLANGYVWIVLAVTLCFGLVGFADDYLKLARSSSRGLPGKAKLAVQVAVSAAAAVAAAEIVGAPLGYGLAIPMFKDLVIDLGWLAVPFAVLVMTGASNAVNLTDGLDGLAIVPVMIAAGCFGFIAYLAGHTVFAEYLQIHPVPGAGELSVLLGALVGASLGFLWYNAPPAMVFMGDTGSLACGGTLGSVAVIVKPELVLAIVGGLFVLEAVSVIVQVASFKLTGKRVFRMAPLHHHFEQKGWKEPTIVIRFWIIAVVLALAGLATLKLR